MSPSIPTTLFLAELSEFLTQMDAGDFALLHLLIAVSITLGLLLQLAFFGGIKDHERHRVMHVVTHLLLKNVLFISYVLTPETLAEFFFCLGWLCCLSLLKVLCEVCQFRVAAIKDAATLHPGTVRNLTLLITLTSAVNTFYFCFVVSAFGGPGLQQLLFVLYEPFYLLLQLAQLGIRFGLRLQRSDAPGPADEYSFFNDNLFDLGKLGITFAHFFHVLAYYFSMSIIDFLLCIYLRHVGQRLRQKWRTLRHYIAASAVIHDMFPTATYAQMRDYCDPCAICYDAFSPESSPGVQGKDSALLSTAAQCILHSLTKVLPCGHLFHLHCIRRWMEHQHVCPVCKRELLAQPQDAAPVYPSVPLDPAGHPHPRP